jgi:hypothetical protein
MSYAELAIGHDGKIYTMEIGKSHKSQLSFPAVKHLPACQ